MKKFTEVYNLISESEISEIYPVISDNFSNVSFSDRVVGTSTPTKDRVNPILLQDIQKAAELANVKIDVTTVVSGHRKGSRHEKGQAVDIARFYNDSGNPVGYSGIQSAKKRGIYDKIMAFVSALETLGYKKNVGESGNPKVVLTFGFDNHHHHVHVSNTTGIPSQETTKLGKPKDDLPTPDDDQETSGTKTVSPELSKALETLKTGGKSKIDVFGGKLNPLMKGFEKAFGQFGMSPTVNEEIERIKKLIK